MQPVPRPVVCTVPLHATVPPPPSTHHCCPLHTAATLYTPPPPPSPCHPRCLYVPSPVSPLATASICCCHRPLRPMHAAASTPRPQTTGHHRRCPQPSCMHHMQPGPLGAHIAVTCISPTSTPLTQAHAPPLCAPCVLALSLAPSVSWPRPWPHPWPCPASQPPSRVPSPPGPHLQPCPASRPHCMCPHPSIAMLHVSAPVACALNSWAPSTAMRRDHVTMFASHSCATGWHTHVGRAWETVHTL